MRLLLVSLAIAGCASAGPGNSIIGGIDDAGVRSTDGSIGRDIDASERVDAEPAIDASLVDAPPVRVTLNQTTSTVIVDNNSLACRATSTTPANNYYRVFAPTDSRGGATLHVTDVSFAIQKAISATADRLQPATVRLGTYTGALGAATLDLTKVQPLASMAIQIGDGSLTRMNVPITADVPGSANLIVELELPANSSLKHQFFIGSNDGDESEPGYLRAASCAFAAPTSFTTVGAGRQISVLISVSGTQ